MNRAIAKQIVDHLHAAFDEANEALYVANNYDVGTLRQVIQAVMARVIAEIDLDILEPIYKEHPDLRPEGMEEIRG